MDFVPAVKTCLMEKYADFNGRASRSEFGGSGWPASFLMQLSVVFSVALL